MAEVSDNEAVKWLQLLSGTVGVGLGAAVIFSNTASKSRVVMGSVIALSGVATAYALSKHSTAAQRTETDPPPTHTEQEIIQRKRRAYYHNVIQ